MSTTILGWVVFGMTVYSVAVLLNLIAELQASAAHASRTKDGGAAVRRRKGDDPDA